MDVGVTGMGRCERLTPNGLTSKSNDAVVMAALALAAGDAAMRPMVAETGAC